MKVTELMPLMERMLTAPVLNTLIIAALIIGVLYIGVDRSAKKITKPYEDLNKILIKIADGIQQQIINNAVDEKQRELRDAKYLDMQSELKETVLRELDDIERILEKVNDTLIEHNTVRCYHRRGEDEKG